MLAPVLAAEGAAHAPAFPLLSAVVLTPVIGAVLTALISRRRGEIAQQVAVLFALVTGALTIAVAVAFDTHEAGFEDEAADTNEDDALADDGDSTGARHE